MSTGRSAASAVAADPPRAPFRPIEFLAAGAWIYFALVGGTAPGEVEPVLRLLNAGLAIVLLVAWARAAPRDADALDRFALLGLLFFLAAAVLARSPRAAFDSALAATAYVALLHVTRTAMGKLSMRARIALWLGTAGTVLAVTYCVLWLLVWSRWLGAAQPASALLNLPLPAGPYAFKHNVALACGLLIPFLWLLPGARPVRLLRAVGAVALALLLLMAGSRGLWLAGLAATACAVALRTDAQGRRLDLRARTWRLPVAIGLVAVVVVVWLVPDLGRAIGDRVGNLLSLRARWDLWAASLREWQSSVVSGVGPGGWPVWLPQTGYFDLTTFSPRHPDSMLFQLLAEAGLLGVAAVAIALVGVGRALRQTPPTPSVWALAFVLAACVTANPTDLPFAVALGIAWLAIAVPGPAVPRSADVARPVHVPSRTVSRAHLALIGILVVAIGAFSWAGLLHEAAQGAAAAGDLDGARRGMELAVTLDPGLALYHRELGALRLASDDLRGAAAELQRGRDLDPADDIATAGLAVVLSLEGLPNRAIGAANEAVRLRRAASINHLVLAWVASRAGDAPRASSALADALVDTPWLTGDGEWNALRGDLAVEGILRTAAQRSVSDPWGLASGNAVWLAAMSNQPLLLAKALAGAAQGQGSLMAVVAMFSCDLPAADAAAVGAATAEAASPGYWVIRAMLDTASGRSSADALRLVSILGSTVPSTDATVSASAFGARADDQWVYRRVPILFSAIGPALPSDDPGTAQWVLDPRGTARTGAPQSRLARCE